MDEGTSADREEHITPSSRCTVLPWRKDSVFTFWLDWVDHNALDSSVILHSSSTLHYGSICGSNKQSIACTPFYCTPANLLAASSKDRYYAMRTCLTLPL